MVKELKRLGLLVEAAMLRRRGRNAETSLRVWKHRSTKRSGNALLTHRVSCARKSFLSVIRIVSSTLAPAVLHFFQNSRVRARGVLLTNIQCDESEVESSSSAFCLFYLGFACRLSRFVPRLESLVSEYMLGHESHVSPRSQLEGAPRAAIAGDRKTAFF